MHFYEFNVLNQNKITARTNYSFFVDDLIAYTTSPNTHLVGTEFNNNNNFALIRLNVVGKERIGASAIHRIKHARIK